MARDSVLSLVVPEPFLTGKFPLPLPNNFTIILLLELLYTLLYLLGSKPHGLLSCGKRVVILVVGADVGRPLTSHFLLLYQVMLLPFLVKCLLALVHDRLDFEEVQR